jgi:hypothetical protein
MQSDETLIVKVTRGRIGVKRAAGYGLRATVGRGTKGPGDQGTKGGQIERWEADSETTRCKIVR